MRWTSMLFFVLVLASGHPFAAATDGGRVRDHTLPVSPGSRTESTLQRAPAVTTAFGSYQVFRRQGLTLVEIHDRGTDRYHLLALDTPATASTFGDDVELRQELPFSDGSGVWSVYRNGSFVGLAFRNRDGSWSYYPATQPQ
jgi:hypothetical protein